VAAKKKPGLQGGSSKVTARRKLAPGKAAIKKHSAKKAEPLDLSTLPAESVTQENRQVCLACVLDVMIRHLGLSVRTAHTQIKRYVPSLEELRAPTPARPFLEGDSHDACPYCGSVVKWHATLSIYRIESGKATDVPRRTLLKSLDEDEFAVVEEKATQQSAFFEWLEGLSELDPDDRYWLRDVSRHYLSRKEPKVDWDTQFAQVHSIRRSRRLESGWEIDSGRLFLAPLLFDELLVLQYLVSRAHKAGGLTLEGRSTLPELMARVRSYLRAIGVKASNPSDAFEQLLAYLGGGDSALRFYYIVDRRDLLERVKTLKDLRVPRSKKRD
jgi:hypothetical protein